MYRKNVCIVITNKKRSKVLLFHRVGADHNAWQFPQGGVDQGESDRQAFWRELKEEIGTDDVKVLKIGKKRIKYKFPDSVKSKFESRGYSYNGQAQRWFLVRLKKGVQSISFAHEPAEFDAYRWASPKKAWKDIIEFKRKAYKKGLKKLGLLD